MKLHLSLVGLLLAVQPAFGQGLPATPPVIVVVGHGTASAPPDFASVSFAVRGEGKTSIEALQSLTDRRKVIETGVLGLRETATVKFETSSISFAEARDTACKDDDDSAVRLSGGACRVTGFVATLNATVRVTPAKRAGDEASLAAQLGAVDIKLEDSGVFDPSALRSAAAKAAMSDAVRQAEIIASASGLRLGPVVRIEDSARQSTNYLEVTAARKRSPAEMVQARLSSPAVSVDFEPSPTSRDVDLDVTYSIVP